MGLPIGGGIGLATSSDGKVTPVDFFGGVLDLALGQAWSDYRPQLEAELVAFLGTGDLIARGFTLYDVGVSIARDLSYSIDRDGNGDVVVSVTTGTNTIRAHSTQPTAAGRWADPALSISFGLSFSYVLDIPPMTGPLSATGLSHARVLSPHIRPENLIADIAFFLNDVFAWISGTDWIDKVEKLVAAADFVSVVNQALGPLNAELSRLAEEGYWYLDVVVDQLDGHSGTLHAQSFPGFASAPADRLGMLLTAHGYERTGIIEGEVHWPATLGSPGMPIAQQLADLSHLSSTVLAGASLPSVAVVPAAATASLSADMTPLAQAAVPRVATEVGSPVGTGLFDRALLRLAPTERPAAVDELRQAKASRIVSLLGTEQTRRLLSQFAGRVSDLAIEVTTPVSSGPGMFPTDRPVGRLGALWATDDDTTCRRRYRLVEVAIDAPLTVRVSLAKGQVWRGAADEVSAEPDGWDGTITVHKQAPKDRFVLQTPLLSGAVKDAVRPVSRGDADAVALNPQPLPPKEVGGLRRVLADRNLVVGGAGGVGGAAAASAVEGVAGAAVGAVSAVAAVEAPTGEVASHLRVDPDLIARVVKRSNPTGKGIVTGIDFTLQEYHPTVIR